MVELEIYRRNYDNRIKNKRVIIKFENIFEKVDVDVSVLLKVNFKNNHFLGYIMIIKNFKENFISIHHFFKDKLCL